MVGKKLRTPSSLPSVDTFFPQLPFHQGKPLCFLHLPKTSGTTVRLVIENAFDGRQTFPSGSRAYNGGHIGIQGALDAEDDLGRFNALSGHFGAEIITHLQPEANLFTWLRDPRDRIISSFFFGVVQERQTNWILFRLRLDQGERLETVFMHWLRSLPIGQGQYFLQFNLISGSQNIANRRKANPQLSLTEAASDIIRRCFFLGLMEDQERSIDAICALTSVLPPKFTPKRNAGTKRTHRLILTPTELAEFDKILAPDIAFYALMKGVYSRQMAALQELAAITPALAYVGDREGLRSHILKLKGAQAEVLTSWNAWDPVLGENLDSREQFKSADGSVDRWRWTAPNPDTFMYFRLPRNSAFNLRIRLYAATPLKNAEKTLVRFAGKQVAAKLMAAVHGRTDLVVSIGRQLSNHLPDLVEIHLHTPEMLDESKIIPYAGTRMLGLAIEDISVEKSSNAFCRLFTQSAL